MIETVNDQLKNISQIEHSRHRSIWNFFVNRFGGLIAYTYLPQKAIQRVGRVPRVEATESSTISRLEAKGFAGFASCYFLSENTTSICGDRQL